MPNPETFLALLERQLPLYLDADPWIQYAAGPVLGLGVTFLLLLAGALFWLRQEAGAVCAGIGLSIAGASLGCLTWLLLEAYQPPTDAWLSTHGEFAVRVAQELMDNPPTTKEELTRVDAWRIYHRAKAEQATLALLAKQLKRVGADPVEIQNFKVVFLQEQSRRRP